MLVEKQRSVDSSSQHCTEKGYQDPAPPSPPSTFIPPQNTAGWVLVLLRSWLLEIPVQDQEAGCVIGMLQLTALS